MKVTYKEFREKTPLGPFYKHSIIGYISSALSPFLAIPCMRYGWSPNKMTMAMIITGIIAGIFLMMPFLVCKGISILLYILWFTWDCADGEVARFTKTFSKYGKQLDWMSHLSCHSIFIIAMWISFMQDKQACMDLLSVVSFILLSAELISRNIVTLTSYSFPDSNASSQWPVKRLLSLKFLTTQLFWFPNMVFIMPSLLVLDKVLHTSFIGYVYVFWAISYSLFIVKKYFQITLHFYRE